MKFLNFKIISSTEIEAASQTLDLHDFVLNTYTFNVKESVFTILMDGLYFHDTDEVSSSATLSTELKIIFKKPIFSRIQEMPVKPDLQDLCKQNCLSSIGIISTKILKEKEKLHEAIHQAILRKKDSEKQGISSDCQSQTTTYQLSDLLTHDELKDTNADPFMEITVSGEDCTISEEESISPDCQLQPIIYQVGHLFTHDELENISADTFMQIDFIYSGEMLIAAETVEIEFTSNFNMAREIDTAENGPQGHTPYSN